ncbi:MAG: type III pantothenate kinase [Negativicutes bacterium]|jgi:type III pantothenate kinase
MLLVLDVGNSNIVAGVYSGQELKNHWRVSSAGGKTADEYGMILDGLFRHSGLQMSDVTAIVMSSVVPTIIVPLQRMAQRYFNLEPLIVGPDTDTGLQLLLDNPREVGSDLIVGAVAAYKKFGGPLIVVDFGTATTFFAVDEEARCLGGVIAPGIGISAEVLFEKTAKLPKVEVAKPPSVIGTNTVHAIQSGILYSVVGQVDEIVRRMKEELGESAKVVATGGFAKLVAQESTTINAVEPFLILDGLQIIYQRSVVKD